MSRRLSERYIRGVPHRVYNILHFESINIYRFDLIYARFSFVARANRVSRTENICDSRCICDTTDWIDYLRKRREINDKSIIVVRKKVRACQFCFLLLQVKQLAICGTYVIIIYLSRDLVKYPICIYTYIVSNVIFSSVILTQPHGTVDSTENFLRKVFPLSIRSLQKRGKLITTMPRVYSYKCV